MMTGSADFNEVFLSDVRTPKDWIVGKRGEGWLVSRTTLKHERNSIGGAQQTGSALKGLIKLARESKVNGRPALEDASVRQRLAEIEGYVTAHQYSGYRQLTKDAKGEDAGIINMMMKLFSTEIGHKTASLSMDLIDEQGMLSAGDRNLGLQPQGGQGWVSMYMYSLGIAVAGGTANIQRNVIGERGLGLPRDAAANRSKS
jgi:alkylation response protein AidB-like acyl-CoA dehydrogenase